MIPGITLLATEEAPKGIDALGIDPVAILLQAGTFVILFLVIRKFALTKITKALDDRKSTIDEGLVNAEKAARQLAEAGVRQEELLAKGRQQADEVIAKAHEEAGLMFKESEEKAAARTAQMIEDAHNKIESDVKKAQESLKSEVKSLVAEAAGVIIDEKIDAKKDPALIEKAVKEAA